MSPKNSPKHKAKYTNVNPIPTYFTFVSYDPDLYATAPLNLVIIINPIKRPVKIPPRGPKVR